MSAALSTGCGLDAPAGFGENRVAVATVDGEPIYARDYVLNFEFGYPHLYRNGNTRLAYLNRMIDEKLLAQEGVRRGLLNHSGVRQLVRDLREELLVGQVFQRYVNDSVTVTEQDIMMAIQEEHTSFRLRYLPATSRMAVERMRDEAQEVGFAAATKAFLSRNEYSLSSSDFESGLVKSHDLHPDLMAAIVNLPVGEISAPIPFRGQFLLLEVLEVRREPALASGQARSAAEQVVFNRKAKSRASDFIDSMMRPLGVRVKSAPYRTLREMLWQLYPQLPLHHNLLDALLDVNASDSLRVILDEILITTTRDDWTIREFLAAYPAARYPLRHQSRSAFENDLYDAIGIHSHDFPVDSFHWIQFYFTLKTDNKSIFPIIIILNFSTNHNSSTFSPLESTGEWTLTWRKLLFHETNPPFNRQHCSFTGCWLFCWNFYLFPFHLLFCAARRRFSWNIDTKSKTFRRYFHLWTAIECLSKTSFLYYREEKQKQIHFSDFPVGCFARIEFSLILEIDFLHENNFDQSEFEFNSST